MNTATSIENAVAEYLETQGVEFHAALVGETTRDSWTADQWNAIFTRTGKETLQLDYYTGTGHRKSKRPMPADIARNPRSVAHAQWVRDNMRPVAPPAAGVLYSVLLDAESADQPFEYWCADLGYDTDSRKALETYLQCQTIGVKVRRFFTPEERAHLAGMLEEY